VKNLLTHYPIFATIYDLALFETSPKCVCLGVLFSSMLGAELTHRQTVQILTTVLVLTDNITLQFRFLLVVYFCTAVVITWLFRLLIWNCRHLNIQLMRTN